MKKFICESVIILKLPVLALSILVYPKSVLSQNTILYSSPNPISQEQTSKDSSTDPKTNNVKEEWHKNGQLKSRVKLKNGLASGKMRVWYEDGSPQLQLKYKNGLLHGKQKELYRTGALKKKSKFISGKKENKFTYFKKRFYY